MTTVSSTNPYASCTIGASSGATLYPDAEVEPQVSVNPLNSQNLVGAWQQDRWSDGGARGLVAGYSADGGHTWGESTLPFSACAPNTPANLRYERASDPWVSIGPDGTAYAIGLPFNISDPNNGVAAATSRDGGRTWANAQPLIADTSSEFVDDKESVTADPTRAGVAYAVWDRLDVPSNKSCHPDYPSPGRHGRRICLGAGDYNGPTFFSRTTNGGRTWQHARIIVQTGVNEQTIGNIIVVDVVDPRTDTLYDIFTYYTPTSASVEVASSTNRGETWSAPRTVAPYYETGQTTPSGAPIRSGGLPEVALDPHSGALYVVWEGHTANNYTDPDGIVFACSTDGGVTWSPPARIDNTPRGGPALLPSIAVNNAGVVGVTYYDFRALQPGNMTTLPTNVWFISSHDGGATFSGDTLIGGPFNFLTAPFAGGYFIGDYQGLVPIDATFQPFFVQTDTTNTPPTDVFTTNVTP